MCLKMFCYQCEQTAGGKGCDRFGVCGKSPEVAAIQDLLVYALKGLSIYAVEGRRVGVNDQGVNRFTCETMFATLTNVNFDAERIAGLVREAVELREALKKRVERAGGRVDFHDGGHGQTGG
jgi:hydroxylamine reductase